MSGRQRGRHSGHLYLQCDYNPLPHSRWTTPDIAVVTNCELQRSSTGTFTLDVIGSNIKQGATVTIGGNAPRKVKFRDLQTGLNTFNRLVLKGRVCSNLPGAIVITNPGESVLAVPVQRKVPVELASLKTTPGERFPLHLAHPRRASALLFILVGCFTRPPGQSLIAKLDR